MRILLVTQYFWPESFRINDLVLAWRDRGHSVTVLTALPNYPSGHLFDGYSWRGPYRQEYGGADVHRVPILTRGARRGARLVANYASFVLSGGAIGPFVARGKYDVAFVYAPSPITSCLPAIWHKWLRGTPVALWVQDLWPDNLVAVGAVRSPRLLGLIGGLTRWIYGQCDDVLVQSEAFIAPVRRVCPEVRSVRVLPNWPDAFYVPHPDAPRLPERGEWPEGFTVMFGGNIGTAQALDHAIDAAERLRGLGVHWVFIGDGHHRPALEARVAALDLASHVHFLGWRRPDAMPRYLSCADALLVSLRRDPGFASTVPAKLQTSLAMGRPVLAALDGEGARLVRESRGGIVVAQESGKALADGVQQLIGMAGADRLAMGQAGRGYAMREFNRDTLIDQLEDWLTRLAEARA